MAGPDQLLGNLVARAAGSTAATADPDAHAPAVISPHPEGWPVVIMISCMLPLVTIFMGLRIWVQAKQRRLLTLDNILLMLAVLIYFTVQALTIGGILIGAFSWIGYAFYGVHMDVGVPITGTVFLIVLLVPMLVKWSICLFLMRVFDSRLFRIAAYTIIAISALVPIFQIVALTTRCGKAGAMFSAKLYQEYCTTAVINIHTHPWTVCTATSSLLSEVSLFILPFPWIWEMTTTKRRRFGISAIFCLGFFSVAADLTNILISFKVLNPTSQAGVNYIRASAPLYIGLPILVACALTFKPVIDKVARLWHKVRSSNASDSDEEKAQVETIGRMRQHRARSDDSEWSILNTRHEVEEPHSVLSKEDSWRPLNTPSTPSTEGSPRFV